MLHSTFLEINSDLEVNLTEATLQRLANRLDAGVPYGSSTAYCALIDAVKAAKEEIVELMFFDTYLRYLSYANRAVEATTPNNVDGKRSGDTQEFALAVQALTQSGSQTSTFYLLDRFK